MMKLIVVAILLCTTTAFAADMSPQTPRPAPPSLLPRDATEVLQLLGSSELKGADVPEAYRLMALLSQIAQQPQQQALQQPEIQKPLSELEAQHAPKN